MSVILLNSFTEMFDGQIQFKKTDKTEMKMAIFIMMKNKNQVKVKIKLMKIILLPIQKINFII